ncbi:MAG: non-ribosomal peptide synthetase [Chitinophagaceae bacterium]
MPETRTWFSSPFTLQHPERVRETLSQSLYRVTQHNPQAIALIDHNRTYTFHELSQRVAGLAEQIQTLDASPEPIALLQGLHINAIAAWFACALANKPFLLLDPNHPKARLLEQLQKAQCQWVLADEETQHLLRHTSDIKILLPDERLREFVPNLGLLADALAMLFPTSGSSGEPKLIAYAATTLQAKVQASIELMQIEPEQRVFIAGSHAQYGFLHHALVFLLAGGTLCMSNIKQTGFQGVVQAIEELGVRHIRFTPSLFRKLVQWSGAHDALKKLEAVRFSGEPLLANDLTLAHSILKSDALIQNVYGSTESALFIWRNTDCPLPLEHDFVPIGHIYPLASFAIDALDEEDKHVGELHIKSSFQALGDFHHGQIQTTRWQETKGHSHERIYATGDLVRLLSDATLLHIGRFGRMVKVQGNRVYLNEVENALLAISGIDEAAVIDVEEEDRTVLYGFVSSKNTHIEPNSLLNHLRNQLPNYMVPKQLTLLPKIPLLVGGKVDYASLVHLINQPVKTNVHANTTSNEWQLLIQLWDKYLWTGAHHEVADFVSLGGDSLGMMSLVAEAEMQLGRKMNAVDFQKNITLIQLAHAFQLPANSLPQQKQTENSYYKEYRSCTVKPSNTALVMPNVFGHAQVHLFREVPLFPEHSIFGANFLIESGRLSDNERWWKCVQQIVAAILSKNIPAPNLVFGFSISGSIAWMVARLLTNTPFCPEWVVLFDAPPLHRYTKMNRGFLPDSFFHAPSNSSLKIIHIRRKPLKSALHGWININEWLPEDGLRFYIEIPSVDHDEIAHPDILKLINKVLWSTMQCEQPISSIEIKQDLPMLPGVLLYRCLEGDINTIKQIMHEYATPPEWFTLSFFIETILAIHKQYGPYEALNIVSYALKQFASSKSLQYLRKRLKRNESQLSLYLTSSIVPKVFFHIECQLNKKSAHTSNSLARSINWIYWLWDVYTALWISKMQKRSTIKSGKP